MSDVRRRLRARAEHVLVLAAMEELRREHPAGTVPPHKSRSDAAWRLLFVPLYRRVPWGVKVRAMRLLGMTADRHGWTPPARTTGEPWRPPVTPP